MKTIGKKTLAWLLSLLLIAGCCLTAGLPKLTVSAETVDSGACEGNVTWALEDDGTLTISGEGDLWASKAEYPWESYRDQIQSVVIESGITSIGWSAFEYCVNLTQVTIPDSVTSIESYAFDGCTSLTEVTIPEGVTSLGAGAFENCSSLTEITLPSTLVSIGNYAFCDCASLTEITIPDSVTSIGNEAFSECHNLTEITLSSSLVSIGNLAFFNCSSLTGIEIPASVTSIGTRAFYWCICLREISVSENNSVYASQDGVLFNKEMDQLIDFPDGKPGSYSVPEGVTSLANYAFSYCYNLASVSLPASLTSIGEDTFLGAQYLEEISVSEENSVYASQDGVVFNKEMDELLLCPEGKSGSYTVPEGVVSIGDYAFYECIFLTEITLPDSVTSIGESAFLNCWDIAKIIIPESVTSIGTDAFAYCESLAIYGYTGSYAETYANENDIPFVDLSYTDIDLPFADVQDPDTYFYDAVQYVYSLGLMTGLDSTTFGPGETLSRAHFATILYRMAGSPSVEGMENPFEDNQSSDTFFYSAVIWCNNAGIITGYFNADGSFSGRFGPSDNITREQLATMLYRYANYAGEDTSASISLDSFGDAASVSVFALEALQWAAAEGIVSGRDTTPPTIAPQDNASRADAAVMLQRYLV